MVYTGDDGQEIFVRYTWRRLFKIRAPLVREFICEFLSTCRIGSEIGDDGLRGLSIMTRKLPVIDIGEIVKLNIYMETDPYRYFLQVLYTAYSSLWIRRISLLYRLEEEVHGMQEVLQGQREVLDNMARDFSRFTTWTITSRAWLIDKDGVPYMKYSKSPVKYERRTRISVQPHILMPFCSESEVERLLAIPTPPLSPVSPTSYPLPPFLMSLPIFTPLPTSSFPLPSSIPSTSGSESIPEADIPLRKRACFTTPTSRYEIGKSSVAAAAARQIRPTLTIADKCRADDKLIGRLRRERRYFCTLATAYAKEDAHSRDYYTQIMDYCQSREVHTRTLVTQVEALQRDVSTLQRQHIEHAQRDVAPEDGDSCS
nr:hypothetical protein [Tanacetum cinerariifolium]